jgi:hypothetical protein
LWTLHSTLILFDVSLKREEVINCMIDGNDNFVFGFVEKWWGMDSTTLRSTRRTYRTCSWSYTKTRCSNRFNIVVHQWSKWILMSKMKWNKK